MDKKVDNQLFDVTMGAFDGQKYASWTVPW